MDLETIANMAIGSSNIILSTKLMEYLIFGIAYHFPTIAAPAIMYDIVKQTSAKYHTKVNPLTTAIKAMGVAIIPTGFLVGLVTHDNQFGFNNIAAYLFGSALVAYWHYSRPVAAPQKPASIK